MCKFLNPEHGLNLNVSKSRILLFFSFLLFLNTKQSLWAKTSLRFKVFSASKSDLPKEVWIRGNGYSKVFEFSNQTELTVDLENRGIYDVVITFQSGIMEQRSITIDSDKKNVEWIQKNKPLANGINVVGKRPDSPPNYTMNQEDAVKMPGGFGDSLKAVQSMPGITPLFQTYTSSSFQNSIQTLNQNANSGSPDKPNGEPGFLVMRGAGTRANQFYFNGLPMSYPFHADGLTSVISNQAIRSMELYSGSYSARYGFATGGIVNVEGFQKRDSNLRVAHLNALLTDIYAYQNITKDLNVSVSGKKYYPNIVFGRVPHLIPTETFLADYTDFQARIGWDINEKHSVSVQTFGAKDKRYPFKEYSQYTPKEAGQSAFQPPSDAARLDRIFRTDGMSHVWKPKGGITNTLNVSRNYFQETTENGLDTLVLDVSKKANLLSLFERVHTVQNEYFNNMTQLENVSELEFLKKHWKVVLGGQYREVEAGYKGRISQFNPDPYYEIFHKQLLSSRQTNAVLEGDSVGTRQLGYFLENRVKFDNFNVNLGVRRDYYDRAKEWRTSPRFGISKEIPYTQSRIFAGIGKHFQAPTDVSRYSARTGNPNLKMEESDHMEIGWDQKLGNVWNVKVEGYRNTFSNLSVADPYAMDPYSRDRDLFRETINPNSNPSLFRANRLNYSNSMTGYSQGIELFIKKEPGAESGFYGWLSYTKSLTKRNRNLPTMTDKEYTTWSAQSSSKELLYQDDTKHYYANYYNDGSYDILLKNSKEELYDFDRTHIFSMVLGWKFSDQGQIGIKTTYLTNYAYTPVSGSSRTTLSQNIAEAFPDLPPVPTTATEGSSFSFLPIYKPVYSDMQRSARLPHYRQLDIRFDRFIHTDWGKMTLYLELVNVTGNRIASGPGAFVPLVPHVPGANPETQYMYINGQQALEANKNKIPYLNFGIELRF
ncbi:TonB-dependent receptor [Leptospira sp. 201903070]|uniref:TonB-dependent receptor n=1 Tax=Leptospira ainlahdjerensis TaxID=2810033 RepID=A0ABS2U9P6_9LEPT|nr:TonB-dependent receptor plug domain-containing protein [Leptospira ainlahdjerensis]MBM9576879.1 TonB-dependent receptor [Leptospira ainlahdjerensis]